MEKIYSGRQTGKTTELIKIAAREHIPIVVISNGTKNFTTEMINKMYRMGEIEDTPDVITYDEIRIYKSKSVNYNHFKCIVDDADWILSRLLNAEIVALSMNKED